jgi:hypothetical protein
MLNLLSTSSHPSVSLAAVDSLNDLCSLADNACKAVSLGAEALLTGLRGQKGDEFDGFIIRVLSKLEKVPQPLQAAAAGVSPSPPAISASAATCAVAAMSISSAGAFEAFSRAYDAAQAPEFCDQLLGSLRQTIFAACRKYGASEEAARDFFKRLQLQAFNHKHELASNMAESAALIWTSAEVLRLGPGKSVEFCSLLNRILREHDAELLAPACGVVRGINLLCVSRRDPSKLRYPPGGKSHRGGGLPAAHMSFFTVGKKYRVPMFMATSFDEEVAYRRELLPMLCARGLRLIVRVGRFWLMAFDRGEPPVHWIVQVDPRGETSLRQAARTLPLSDWLRRGGHAHCAGTAASM